MVVEEEVPNQETGTVRILALTDTQTGTAEATSTTTVEHSQPGDTLTSNALVDLDLCGTTLKSRINAKLIQQRFGPLAHQADETIPMRQYP